jgi:branched-chain amino acid aminotransferase
LFFLLLKKLCRASETLAQPWFQPNNPRSMIYDAGYDQDISDIVHRRSEILINPGINYLRSMFVFIDDDFYPEAAAAIPLNDLSITRGYAVFDYFKVLGGKAIFLNDHLNRLYFSANEMCLSPGYSKKALEKIIMDFIEKNGKEDAGIRITITGGSSADGYTLGKPRLIITMHSLVWPPKGIENGIHLSSIAYQRQLSQVKTIDYLFAIRMQPLLSAENSDDFLYHKNEEISECPRANFFIVTKEDLVYTPAEKILKGVTRNKLIAHALGKYKIEEGIVTLSDALNAKEAFITSTTKGVMPVQTLDGKTIGDGSREFTIAYQALLNDLISREQ